VHKAHAAQTAKRWNEQRIVTRRSQEPHARCIRCGTDPVGARAAVEIAVPPLLCSRAGSEVDTIRDRRVSVATQRDCGRGCQRWSQAGDAAARSQRTFAAICTSEVRCIRLCMHDDSPSWLSCECTVSEPQRCSAMSCQPHLGGWEFLWTRFVKVVAMSNHVPHVLRALVPASLAHAHVALHHRQRHAIRTQTAQAETQTNVAPRQPEWSSAAQSCNQLPHS